MSNKTFVYIYTVVLFGLTFLFVRRLFENIKTGDFDYLKLGLNLGIIIVLILKIIRLGKIENQKTDS
ncbi:hypothetical protein [Flavobacterium sp.]|jgi:hypothetical protein|uniref:hypothetical protein n=1 Tax=Flavobacterium sp. TaxID=239 RepID=UPI0022C1919A|nr:hypothetical protein [Flavobacterium sp.]MCZ8145035.1 hypothetical protein [Flavobacterium sp.]MCZ8368037.1 hypothetical protein [Flavobacterium sp.]